jgi:hypothetical protein
MMQVILRPDEWEVLEILVRHSDEGFTWHKVSEMRAKMTSAVISRRFDAIVRFLKGSGLIEQEMFSRKVERERVVRFGEHHSVSISNRKTFGCLRATAPGILHVRNHRIDPLSELPTAVSDESGNPATALAAGSGESNVGSTGGGNQSNPLDPTVDRNTFCFLFDGKSCFLGKTKEFAFIERLSRRKPYNVAVTTIIEDVWGKHLPLKGPVHTIASSLRKKLKEAKMHAIHIDGNSLRGRYIMKIRHEENESFRKD